MLKISTINKLDKYVNLQNDESGEALGHLLEAYSGANTLHHSSKVRDILEEILLKELAWYEKHTKIVEGTEMIEHWTCELQFKGQDY